MDIFFHDFWYLNFWSLFIIDFYTFTSFVVVCLFVCLLEVHGSDIPPGCADWSVHSQEFQFLGPLIIPLLRNLART